MAVSSARPPATNTYEYNPACGCEVCEWGGDIPEHHPLRGHSFAYGQPHVPPNTRAPWA